MQATEQQIHKVTQRLRSGQISAEVVETVEKVLEHPERSMHLSQFDRHLRIDLMVNYDFSVDWLVKCNGFSYCNEDVTSANFPMWEMGVRDVTLEFYEFDYAVDYDYASKQIEATGFVSQDIITLLTLARYHPCKQLRRPIVSLGSQCPDRYGKPGDQCVPALVSSAGQRGLALISQRMVFHPEYQFLVSRPQPHK